MRNFDFFCPGANSTNIPGARIDRLFLNPLENGRTAARVAKSIELQGGAKPCHVILDSSGYDLWVAEKKGRRISNDPSRPMKSNSKELNLAPCHVVAVATKLQVTEFVGLDKPIQNVLPFDREEEFRRKLNFNLPWAVETAELREKHCPQIGLLLPVQCFTIKQLDLFLNEIRTLAFDGFAMPTRTATLSEIALFLHRFWQIGIRRVHLLGVTKFLSLALSAYFGRHVFEEFSVDSRTWQIQGMHNIYMNPQNLSKTEISQNTEIDPSIKMDCNCPWCRNRTFSYIKHLPYSDRVQLLYCHNYHAISRLCGVLYDRSRSIGELELFLQTYATEKQRHPDKNTDEVRDLITALSVIETLKDEDTRDLEKLLIG